MTLKAEAKGYGLVNTGVCRALEQAMLGGISSCLSPIGCINLV